jgi:protein-S-isoprenylcysteine O-methyltransferase Ste14
MDGSLLLLPWFMGVLYSSIPLFWFAIHPLAAPWQRMQRSPYLILLPLWAIVMAALAAATWPWHTLQFYSSWWPLAPAAVFFALGLRTYLTIRSEFGLRKLSGEAELRPHEHEQKLVTTGLHARMRHPIYVAHICVMIALAVVSGLLVNFLLLALALLFTFPLMIWMEEQELEKRFGQAYRTYKKTVPLIPKFITSDLRRSSSVNSHTSNEGRP